MAQPASTDERNLMEADDPSSLAPDEQVIYFLEKYKWYLLLLLVGGSAAFLYQYFGAVISENRQEARAEAFFAAVESEDKIAFAESHSNHPLSGVALFEVARNQFEAGQYSDAADTYRRAARHLGETPVAYRAQLAAGVALARDGRHAEAFDYLGSASNQLLVPASIEAEMLFNQAVIAHLMGREDAFNDIFQRIQNHPFGQMWANRLIPVRAAALGEIVPEDELPQPAIQMDLLEDASEPTVFPGEEIPAGIALPPMEFGVEESSSDPLPGQE